MNCISKCNNKKCKMAKTCFRIHKAQGSQDISANICNHGNGFRWYKAI